MRFLRRGGKAGLPVEAESVDDAEAPETSSRPASLEADEAVDTSAEADASPAPDAPAAETGTDAEPKSDEPAANEEPDAPAATADSARDAAHGEHAEPDADAPGEPDAAEPGLAVAGTVPVAVEATAEPARRPTSRSRRKRAPDAEPTPEPTPDALAPAMPPSGDDEDLGALVAGGRNASESEPEPAPPPAPAHPFAPNLVIDDTVWPDPLADGRPGALRLASLHLRTGQHALARAELESLAGRGRLDEPALLDLAEVRWRTGDLSGAGDAANALLARGTEAPLALVIAAEAVASAGRPSEARRLSARALEVVDGPLDLVFAGMPRALIWPVAAIAEPSPAAPRRRGRRAKREEDGAPSTASEAFAGGRAALAKGDASRAALLLGVAMRLEPGFAEDVLRAVAGRDDQPLLALVRGDALRLLGREAEALEAFDRARGRSSASATASSEPAGPGLFDDDPG